MSELKVDTLTGKTSAGDITVTSEGGAATMQLQQGLAKAWVKFNGTGTIATGDSLNISSLTDNGAGDYTTNFSNVFGTVNYAAPYGRSIDSSGYPGGGFAGTPSYLTTSVRLRPQRSTGGVNYDTTIVTTSNHGDLA